MNFSSNDEIFAHLDLLNRQAESRRAYWLERLERNVAGLGVAGQPDPVGDDPPRSRRGLGDRPRPGPDPESTPYVTLPQRTTHGGDFGPAVRAKLIAEALGR